MNDMNNTIFSFDDYVETEDRVCAGADWLDRNYPYWYELIVTPNIESRSDCILCQITGLHVWKEAKVATGLSDTDAILLGFDKMICCKFGPMGIRGDNYADLDRCWLEEVNARKTLPRIGVNINPPRIRANV